MPKALFCALFFLFSPTVFSSEQSLSFKEAIQMALEKNFDIQIAQLDKAIGTSFVNTAYSIFDFTFTSQIDWTENQAKAVSSITGTKNTTKQYNFGLSKTIDLGTKFDLQFINIHKETNSAFSKTKDYWEPKLQLTLTQPLLNNFFGFNDRQKLKQALAKEEILKNQSQDKIETILALVASRYWELSATESKLRIKKKAYAQALKLHEANKRKLKLGTVEETDFLASKANVRTRENDILMAESELEVAKATLKEALKSDENLSTKNSLRFKEEAFDISKTIHNAMKYRKDYQMLKEDFQLKNITHNISKNALLPSVDAVGAVSYNGVNKEYRSAYNEIEHFDFPQYYAGAQIKYPLGNFAAEGAYEKSRAEKLQSTYQLEKWKHEIKVEITKKIELLKLAKQEVETTKDIATLLLKKMNSEEKKFKQGRSSINFLIQFQEDYLRGEEAHIQTLLKHEKNFIDLKKSEGTLLDMYIRPEFGG